MRIRNPIAVASCLCILYGMRAEGPVADVGQSLEEEAVAEESDAIVSERDSVELVDDSSVGESISRRPDLSFQNVTIDGQGSGVSLGSISADAVESVQVMKAVTPDLDADTRGGSVSLKTRPTYDQDLKAKGSVELEYKANDGSIGNEEIFSWGGRLDEKGRFGGRLNMRQERDFFQLDRLRADWQVAEIDGESRFVLSESEISSFHSDSSELEVGGVFDFKASEHLSFFTRANWQSVDRESFQPRLKFHYGHGVYTQADASGARVEGASVRRSVVERESEDREWETSFGSVFENEDWEASAQYVFQDEKYSQPSFFYVDFVNEDVDLEYELDASGFPVNTAPEQQELEDARRYSFNDMNVQDAFSNEESDSVAKLDLKFRNMGKSGQSFLKAGVKSRKREERRLSRDTVFDRYGSGGYTLDEVALESDLGRVVEGRYELGLVPSPEKGRAFFDANRDGFELSELRTRERSDSNTYFAEETVDSAYAMANWELDRWRSIVGWRQERTTVAFQANEVIVGEDSEDRDEDGDTEETVYLGTNPTTGNNTYSHGFPNVHALYRVSGTVNLIGSYTNTIQRPGYGQVVPYRRVDRDDREIDEGNPLLRPTLYENFDLSLDVALADHHNFSFELFRKSVEDIVFSSKSVVGSGVYAGYELRRRENGPTATIQGAEISWHSALEAGPLPKGLSMNANYVVNDTTTEYPERSGEILSVAGIPDSELKLTLNYETEKIFAQLLYERRDVTLLRVANTAAADLFEGAESGFNFDFSYRATPKLRYFVVARNVFDDPEGRRYEGEESRLSHYENNHWALRTGLRFEL